MDQHRPRPQFFAVCLLAVVYLHSRSNRLENERNLASWQQLADEVQEPDASE